jgi:hypothetical protein
MVRAEAPDEVMSEETRAQEIGLLVGVSGSVDVPQLQTCASGMAAALEAIRPAHVRGDVGIAYLCPGAMESCGEDEIAGSIRLLPYEAHGTANPQLPWLVPSAVYEGIFRLADRRHATACVVLHPDLAALTPQAIARLATPVLKGECDLTMPIYPVERFEGLVNFGILEPLSRALYGRRVQSPLGIDFAISGGFISTYLGRSGVKPQANGGLFWPVAEAAMRDRRICQAALEVHHGFTAEGVDLSTMLGQVVGPLFLAMEANAAFWQRTRGSQSVPLLGVPVTQHSGERTADSRPMAEAFQLGFRNLQDIWSMVLPPVSLLELKRISRSTPESFHMPDTLWARIVYDFALAHRLRTIGRSHLFGAFTPLYLGWVASYVCEVAGLSETDAEARRERLGRAFEEAKPYLLQRWRWPDRFNP